MRWFSKVGNFPCTFLLNNNSDGAIFVVLWCVLRYWNKERFSSCCHTFPSATVLWMALMALKIFCPVSERQLMLSWIAQFRFPEIANNDQLRLKDDLLKEAFASIVSQYRTVHDWRKQQPCNHHYSWLLDSKLHRVTYGTCVHRNECFFIGIEIRHNGCFRQSQFYVFNTFC